jgi:hypothetical protein
MNNLFWTRYAIAAKFVLAAVAGAAIARGLV